MSTQEQKILVVDDLADWRETIMGLLTDAGFHVAVAESAPRALQMIAAGDFDLALVDMRLDESDEENQEGLHLAAEIGKRWPGIKRVIITGYGKPETIARAREPNAAGERVADEFIPKDLTQDLIATIRQVLASEN